MGLHIGYKFKCQQNLDLGAATWDDHFVLEDVAC